MSYVCMSRVKGEQLVQLQLLTCRSLSHFRIGCWNRTYLEFNMANILGTIKNRQTKVYLRSFNQFVLMSIIVKSQQKHCTIWRILRCLIWLNTDWLTWSRCCCLLCHVSWVECLKKNQWFRQSWIGWLKRKIANIKLSKWHESWWYRCQM